MEEINTVTTVNQKDGKYGVALGKDNWYNGMGTCPVRKGQKVKITFEVNGMWKNIKNIEVVDDGFNIADKADIAQMSKMKNMTNARVCALTCAKDIALADNTPEAKLTESIISTAEQFMKFLEG